MSIVPSGDESAELVPIGRRNVSPQLRAVVDLHANSLLADFVLQLDPLGLETTKMMIKVLRQVETSYWTRFKRRLTEDELVGTLETLIKDPKARQQIVQLYQASRECRKALVQQ